MRMSVLDGYRALWAGKTMWTGFSKNLIKNCQYVFPEHLSLWTERESPYTSTLQTCANPVKAKWGMISSSQSKWSTK